MGAWGPGLYQDDIAQDIKSEYVEQLRKGKSETEVYEEFLSDFSFIFGDRDDEPIFWFALADTQWKLGRLLPEVKAKAIAWIDSGIDQQRWQDEDPKLALKRSQVLADLKEKLNSPPPEKKTIKPYK